MVMLDLMHQLEYEIGVAHCNFHLRGSDSDSDEKLVKTKTQTLGIPYYSIDFDTVNYAKKNNISVEMSARELRYAWFNEVADKNTYDYIATAHHSDDSAETFFLNMIRGTGIRGLHGILPISGKIIRPILFANRREIEEYASQHHIVYHEDYTNREDSYKRNYIRHHIIPAFRELQNSFDDNLSKTMEILHSQENIYFNHIKDVKNKISKTENEILYLDRNAIEKLENSKTYLFEILHPLGFNEDQVDSMLNLKGVCKGKIFESKNHRLLVQGSEFIIRQKKTIEEDMNFSFDFSKGKISSNCDFLNFETNNIKHFEGFSKNKNAAYFDLDKLCFPLKLRRWQKGDYFYPFGMKGSKKLSNFFNDNKIDIFSKNNIPVLCNGDGNILWIVGKRSDERFKVDDNTKNVLTIKYTCP